MEPCQDKKSSASRSRSAAKMKLLRTTTMSIYLSGTYKTHKGQHHSDLKTTHNFSSLQLPLFSLPTTSTMLWWAKCTSEGSLTVAEDTGVKRAERGDEGVIVPRAASSFLGSWIAFRSQFVRSDRSCCLICGTFGLLACGYI